MEADLEHFNKKMQKVTTESYYNHFVKPSVKKHIDSHYTQYIVFVAQMRSAANRALVDEEWLEQEIINLGLEEYMLGTADVDEGFIIGFQFTTLHAKKIFIEWLEKENTHNLIQINPMEATVVSFRIKPFPFGFTQNHLQTQLSNFGTISGFKYTTKKFGSREILKNELQFSLHIKDGIDRKSLPCYIKHNKAFFPLASRQLPSICSLCRERGHGRSACDYTWCVACNSKQLHIHNCPKSQDQQQTTEVPSSFPQLLDAQDATSAVDILPTDSAPESQEFPPSTTSDFVQTVSNKSNKNKIKKPKPVMFYDSDSETNDLTDKECPAPMDATTDIAKRKHDDITTTTSEEDPGTRPNTYTRNVKKYNKK